MKGSNRSMTEKCENCDEYSNGRADAEEEISHGGRYRTCMWCGWYEVLDYDGTSLESGMGDPVKPSRLLNSGKPT